MKTLYSIIIIIIILFFGLFIFQSWNQNREVKVENNPEKTSIVSCYIARLAKDIYTLNIERQSGENVSGTLSFNNFEKDSSTGTFSGTFKDNILLADYAFRSEGMDSVMQVIFKKTENGFIRGYGVVDEKGINFSNINNITFDSSSPLFVFTKDYCPVNKEQVNLSGQYICLPHKDSTQTQTLECALGLKTDNGLYYALDFNFMSETQPTDLKTGDRISAFGIITPIEKLDTNAWQKYPIVGIFSVTNSLKKI